MRKALTYLVRCAFIHGRSAVCKLQKHQLLKRAVMNQPVAGVPRGYTLPVHLADRRWTSIVCPLANSTAALNRAVNNWGLGNQAWKAAASRAHDKKASRYLLVLSGAKWNGPTACAVLANRGHPFAASASTEDRVEAPGMRKNMRFFKVLKPWSFCAPTDLKRQIGYLLSLTVSNLDAEQKHAHRLAVTE